MTDAGDPIPGVRPRRRWLLPTALVVSLAANVFLGSILIGQFAHQRERRSDLGDFQSFRRFAETMPEESRQVIRDSFIARRGEMRPQRMELREARVAVRRALAADPYDRLAAQSAFERLRRANEALSRSAQGALIEAAGKLPPDQRRRIAESREPPRPQGR